MELIGVILGIIGAFSVASGKAFLFGYICFFISSLLLSITAWRKNQYNLLALQLVFLLANCYGLITFWE